MNTFGIPFFCLVQVFACIHSNAACAGTGAATLAQDWRITRAVSAPWAPADTLRPASLTWVGRPVTFHHDSVDGPGSLHCGHAVLEPTRYPAEGLFQGSLPTPAGAAAQALGIAHLPLAGVRLRCDSGVFEFHSVDAETLLLGLDNQVLTLSRTPGTMAAANAPEGRTQAFLEAHFNGDMAFTSSTMNAHRAWFSKTLEAAMTEYFARPALDDELPAIDGDAFTDSQEYPRRFAVGKARVSNDQAEVPVRVSDAFDDRTIVYVLRRKAGEWRLDDLRFASGKTLVDLLK